MFACHKTECQRLPATHWKMKMYHLESTAKIVYAICALFDTEKNGIHNTNECNNRALLNQ